MIKSDDVNLLEVLELLESVDLQLENSDSHQTPTKEAEPLISQLNLFESKLSRKLEQEARDIHYSEIKRAEQVLEKVRNKQKTLLLLSTLMVSSGSSDRYFPLPFKSKDKTKRKDTGYLHSDLFSTERIMSSGPPEIADEEIVYDPATDFIGEGSYGLVYKGVCRGKKVAIKVPKKQLNPREIEQFKQEINFMSKLFHPNIVLFMGACTKPTIRIVTELCVTDVETIIRSNNQIKLCDRMKMAKGAAQGMNWLHGICKILHRDLKTANLLVAEDGTVKVTDFGFSQIFEVGKTFTGKAKGTPLWMAPEVMMEEETNEKRDVYSFGIILWELLTRKPPYSEHKVYKDFKQSICAGARPEIPLNTLPSLKYLITQCWAGDFQLRPNFSEIIFRLNEVIVDSAIVFPDAQTFWKYNFFVRNGEELEESCSWHKFKQILVEDLNLSESERKCLRALKTYIVSKRNTEISDVTATGPYVTMESFNQTVIWFGNFFMKGGEGKSVLQNFYDLSREPYFHGDISKEDAVSLLQMQPQGTYLIRLSSTTPEKPFTLSTKTSRTTVDHRRIEQIHPGRPSQVYNLKINQENYVAPNITVLIEKCKNELRLTQACTTEGATSDYIT